MSLGEQPVAELLAKLAAKAPTPGGGAAASLAGSIAAALGSMVVAYSQGKKDSAAHEPLFTRAAEELARARLLFLQLADEDMAAYAALSRARRLPEGDPGRLAIGELTQAATQVPLVLMAAATELLRLFESLAPVANRHLLSDLGIAATLAGSTARAAHWLVRINASSLESPDAEMALQSADEMASAAGALLAKVERACAART